MNSVSFSIPQSRPAGFSASIVVTLVSALLLFIGFVALPYSATQRAVEIPVTLTLQIMPVLLSLATALFALRAWRSPAYASVDLGLAFGIGVLVLAAYHIRTLSLDAGPTLGDSFSRTGLGFWVSLVGALGLIGQRWLPRPEVDLLAKRNAVGKTWQRVFSGANVVALIALVLIAITIINQAFGLVEMKYTIDPATLSDRPLEELTEAELVAIVQEAAPNKIRVIIRDTLSVVPNAQFTTLPINQVLAGRIYPTELGDLGINDLTTEQHLAILSDNLSQEQMLNVVTTQVVNAQVVKSWLLFDSIFNRTAIEEEVKAENPDAKLEFRSWISGGFISRSIASSATNAGLRTALLGSLWIISITILLAFPIGIGAAIYLEEYANTSSKASDSFVTRAVSLFNRLIEINIRNLAGVPSIIYGMLGLTVFVKWAEPFFSGRVFGMTDTNGRTVLAAAFTMALLILPVIIINAQEAIRAVPSTIREASFGIGATKWQTIWRQVLPSSLPGIMTGMILSMSRAVGETAPLIVVGASTFIGIDPNGPFSKFTVIPIQIFQWTGRPELEFKNTAAAAIIVLLVLLVLLNGTAIIIRQRFSRRVQ